MGWLPFLRGAGNWLRQSPCSFTQTLWHAFLENWMATGLNRSSTVQRHLTGQQSLHYMCSTHVAEHKILSTVTIRPTSPQAYFWCYSLQDLWNPFFFFLFKSLCCCFCWLVCMNLEEVFCKSPILLHSDTSVFIFGLVFMFTAVFTLPVNKPHQMFNRIFSISDCIFILNNDWKFWRPSIILTGS